MVLVLLLALVAGLLASWVWSGRLRAAQEQDRRDLNLFLDASSAGWAEVTDQFFTVPESAASVIGALFGELDEPQERSALLLETIRSSTAMDAAFVGYPNGEFMFVARSDQESPGGFRTRTISIDGDQRETVLTWTDAEFNEVRRELDPADTYDPRARPWYLQPDQAVSDLWTDPYVFASSQQPGITFSQRILDDAGEQLGVVGIDMQLSQLGEFLDLLAPGTNGEAAVVRGDGTAIAASGVRGLTEAGGVATTKSVEELLAAIEIAEATERKIALERSPNGLHTTVTRVARPSQDWYLTVDANDDDFLGDSKNSTAQNLPGLLAVGLASAIVVGSAAYRTSRYRERLREEAEVDELTGVLTRRAVRRSIIRRLNRSKEPVAVGIIDLDNFKAVNDNHGHPVGDVVLAAAAQRICDEVEEGRATCGRLGGDEFCVVADEHFDWTRIARTLREPIVVGDTEFRLGGSIGVSVVQPGSDRNLEEILRAADRGLFNVKSTGGDGVFYAGLDGDDLELAASMDQQAASRATTPPASSRAR